jgi:hypothetical protein
MSLNPVLLNGLRSNQVKEPVEFKERFTALGYRSRKFANFTREVNDFPNATVSITIGGSAGWIEQLAGLTNVSVGVVSGTNFENKISVNQVVGTGIFSEGAKGIVAFGQAAYIGSIGAAVLEGLDLGSLGGNVLYANPEAMTLMGNVQQITMVEPVDSAKLAQHIVLQEYSLSAQLRRLRKLQAGWDGDVAPGISDVTGNMAEEVIQEVQRVTLSRLATLTTHLAPLPDGSLRFECTHSNKELFITISDKAVEIQAWQPLDAVESFGYWKTDAAGAREHLEWLVK